MEYRIERWHPKDGGLAELAEVLHASVHAGASVSFLLPFEAKDAEAFWRDKVAPGAAAGTRIVLVARAGERIVGTVQLVLETPPNQRHRADVAKMLVHPEFRRHGIARALMAAIEERAREERRTLITLDTRTGDAAEGLYRSMGYICMGRIPRYSRAQDGDLLEDASFYYKELDA